MKGFKTIVTYLLPFSTTYMYTLTQGYEEKTKFSFKDICILKIMVYRFQSVTSSR